MACRFHCRWDAGLGAAIPWRHFMQTTKIVREIPANEPAVEDIFGDYWNEVGQ